MKENDFLKLNKYQSVKYINPNIKSLASLILLKKSLYKQENPKKHWRLWLKFRKRFLKSKKKENKKLICEYCGRDDLKINHYKTPKSCRATIDHIIPKSKNGKIFDLDNLAVACYPCNMKKGDKLIEHTKILT